MSPVTADLVWPGSPWEDMGCRQPTSGALKFRDLTEGVCSGSLYSHPLLAVTRFLHVSECCMEAEFCWVGIENTMVDKTWLALSHPLESLFLF